jgi:hypothetical protein
MTGEVEAVDDSGLLFTGRRSRAAPPMIGEAQHLRGGALTARGTKQGMLMTGEAEAVDGGDLLFTGRRSRAATRDSKQPG